MEVVCDTTPTAQSIVGFICKVWISCVMQFERYCHVSLFYLLLWHRQDLGALSLENQPTCICVDGRVGPERTLELHT